MTKAAKTFFKPGSSMRDLPQAVQNMAAISLLVPYLNDLEKIEELIDLTALQEKLAGEVLRLQDVEKWCAIEEVERISGILMIVEAVQQALREYKKWVESDPVVQQTLADYRTALAKAAK